MKKQDDILSKDKIDVSSAAAAAAVFSETLTHAHHLGMTPVAIPAAVPGPPHSVPPSSFPMAGAMKFEWIC